MNFELGLPFMTSVVLLRINNVILGIWSRGETWMDCFEVDIYISPK
jgi:hypothetical protein